MQNGFMQQLKMQWRRLWGQQPQGQALPPAALDEAMRQRINALPPPLQPGEQRIDSQPLVVFDLETTGLDIHKDTVLASGAVRLEQLAIALGKPHEAIFKADVSLKADSQLIHGLTLADLDAGQDPRLALLELLEYGQDAIWLAYHAAFDHIMLERAAKHWLGLGPERLPRPYDIAHIAAMLFPCHTVPHAGLDHWIQTFALDMPARHHAAADAFATAQVGMIVLHEAQRQGYATWGALVAALAQYKQAQERESERNLAGGF